MSLREYTKLQQKKEEKKEKRNRTSNPYEIGTQRKPTTRSATSEQSYKDMKATFMGINLEHQQQNMSYSDVHKPIEWEQKEVSKNLGSLDQPQRRSVRAGTDNRKSTDRIPGQWYFCQLMTKQATKLFEKYVCVFSEGRFVDIAYRDDVNMPVAAPGGFFSTGLWNQCQFSEKPIVLKIYTPGHIAVAIYWTQVNVVEFWDTAKFNPKKEYPYLEETLCGFIRQDFHLNHTPKFIDLTPNGYLQKGTSDMNDNFCQTWIWFWVFMRTVLKCDAYHINDWLLSLTNDERLQLIVDFWHELSVGEYPRVTKQAVKDVCISFGLTDE